MRDITQGKSEAHSGSRINAMSDLEDGESELKGFWMWSDPKLGTTERIQLNKLT